MQGRMQLEYLKSITDWRDVIVWGLNQEDIVELGNVIVDKELQRTSEDQITKAVYKALTKH
jgi:ornithine cyclodeaminase/alanine dehydrogenase-like protein (mu-crystallin family)